MKISRKRNGGLTINVSPEEAATWGLAIPQSRPNTFYQNVIGARVPCAYNAPECAAVRFAPNGVGRYQHTTCAEGRAALAAR